MKKIIISLCLLLICCSAYSQPTLRKGRKIPIEGERRPNLTVVNTPLKLCIDRPSRPGTYPERVLPKPSIKILSDGTFSNLVTASHALSAETYKMWNIGETITVFLSSKNSTEFMREKVKFYARKWEEIANIKFAFTDVFNDAKIKVEFSNDNRSWSMVGRDALEFAVGQFTMHYGWFDDRTPDAEYSRVVLHEFGHSLGFIHEHQSPVSQIKWDKEKVYTEFSGPPNNWSRADIDANIFAKYSGTSTNSSVFDPNSIMEYYFPPELTVDRMVFPFNTVFSVTDRKYAGQVYPFQVTPETASGTLRTGDDCDLVDFVVEYNVVPSDKIEFTLSLGENNNKPVTWWKQIQVPLKNGNIDLALENTRGLATSGLINFADIDQQRGIPFWKAKFAGAHTLLGFRWNVLEALRGGCRVKLVWKSDSCS